VSPDILIQTNNDGYYVLEDQPFESSEGFYCNQNEIRAVLNFVIDKKDFYANILKGKPNIPEICLDCFINVNFQSSPDHCSIQCTMVMDCGELKQIDLQGNIPKDIRSFDLGTYTIKGGILEFNRY
jgi:hypothetical protein